MEGIVFVNRKEFVVREFEETTKPDHLVFYWMPDEYPNRKEFYLPNGVEVAWIKNFKECRVIISYKTNILFEKKTYSAITVAGLMNDFLLKSDEELKNFSFTKGGVGTENLKVESTGNSKTIRQILITIIIHLTLLQGLNYVNHKHVRRWIYPIIGYISIFQFINVFLKFIPVLADFTNRSLIGAIVLFIGLTIAYFIGLIDALLELHQLKYKPNPASIFIRKMTSDE